MINRDRQTEIFIVTAVSTHILHNASLILEVKDKIMQVLSVHKKISNRSYQVKLGTFQTRESDDLSQHW
jgi:hypothetical protein